MRLARTTCLLAAAALANAAAEPEFFILKSSVLVGQPDKEAFNGLTMTLLAPNEDIGLPQVPLFLTDSQEGTVVFTAEQDAKPIGNYPALYYLSYNRTANHGNFHYYGQLGFDTDPFAKWQPVLFPISDKPTFGNQNARFAFSGTGSHQTLIWNNFPANEFPPYTGWLLCTWSYGLPQLFFTTREFDPYTVLPNCAQIDLQVIPTPNAS